MDSQDLISLPRAKPRRLAASVVYLAFRLLRRVLPRRAFLELLLTLSWALNRIAYEQALSALGLERGMELIRPHTGAFLDAHVGADADVLELGGGPGLFTPRLASLARSVTYLDRDPAARDSARKRCARRDNVAFLLGDDLEPIAGTSFDVAVLLHVLEHFSDPLAALERLRGQCARVLIEVPDAEAIPLLRVRLALGAPFHTDDDHCSEFSATSLAGVMTRAGWKVVSIEKRNGALLAVGERG